MPRHASFVPTGVIPAVLLPFDDELVDRREELPPPPERRRARSRGYRPITINAHATEVGSCSFDEQRRVLEITADEIGDKPADRPRRLCRRQPRGGQDRAWRSRGGASALLVFPPGPFTLGQSAEMAIAHFRRIADASDLPIIVFEYPLATGQGYPLDTLLKLLDAVPIDPRDQGLDPQRPASRAASPHAAKPAAAGERAQHQLVVALLLARARLQGPALGLGQRHRRSSGAALPRGRRRTISPRPRPPQRSHLPDRARLLLPIPSSTCTTA